MRIGGLASGLDTQNLVQELMKAERMPLDRLIQDRIRMEWQRDAYRDTNLQLSNLRDSFAARGLGLQSTFLQKSVASSNEGVVKATGSAAALDGTIQMKVNQLATASTYVSKGIEVEEGQAFSQLTAADLVGEDFFTDGKAEISFQVKKPGSSTAEEVKLTINQDDTIDSVLKKLNSSNAGVQAYVDHNASSENGPQVVLTMNDTGAGAEINFSKDPNAAELFKGLGFAVTDDDDKKLDFATDGEGKQLGQEGQNAKVVINGHTTERTTNNFNINGITYNLNGVSAGDQTVMITTKTDTDKIMEDIMKFVEDYNELIDTLNGALREKRHRDFPPLTDEQRKDMSDKEIELWEEKAKSGLLRNDSTLSSALTQMRTALYSQVGGADSIIRDLSQIGLVSSKDYMDGGKIILDTTTRTIDGKSMNGEERLRHYIENNGEELHQLFMADGEEYGEQGILRRMRGTLDTTIQTVTERAGREGRTNQQFTLGRQLTSIEDRISNFERRLQQKEDAYWRQFTSLESVMARMNAQADQMMAMLNPQG